LSASGPNRRGSPPLAGPNAGPVCRGTLTSGVEPALIACLRSASMVFYERACERAARLYLLSQALQGKCIDMPCLDHTPPAGVQARVQSLFELPTANRLTGPSIVKRSTAPHWRRRQLCTPRSNPPVLSLFRPVLAAPPHRLFAFHPPPLPCAAASTHTPPSRPASTHHLPRPPPAR
jgi:hypothetical protein